jgi:hypothetical protein
MPGAAPSELRRFGLTVGGVFLVLAAISRWRGHELAPLVLAALGAGLFVPGLVAPRVLGPVQRGWMRAAHVLGEVNTRIILGAFFYLVLAPIGFVMRRLVRDPLDRRLDDGRATNWIRREPAPVDPARYQQQF